MLKQDDAIGLCLNSDFHTYNNRNKIIKYFTPISQ